MTITLTWENAEQSVLRYDFEGRWTWEEYLKVMNQVCIMIASVDHRVDAIANMKPGIMPTNGTALTLARAALRKLPPNRGVVVVVTNPFIGALLSTFKNFDREIGAILRAAKSVDEARLIIQHERDAMIDRS